MIAAETWLRDVYRAFNARDIEAVLRVLHPDVDWPNGMEGGRVHGREAVRAYWTRQWALIDPRVDPIGVEPAGDGRFNVDVHQVVHDLGGALLLDTHVRHLYTVETGLITRMDIESPDPAR
jgi:hypothetical protein